MIPTYHVERNQLIPKILKKLVDESEKYYYNYGADAFNYCSYVDAHIDNMKKFGENHEEIGKLNEFVRSIYKTKKTPDYLGQLTPTDAKKFEKIVDLNLVKKREKFVEPNTLIDYYCE
jgi:hypothetical protein